MSTSLQVQNEQMSEIKELLERAIGVLEETRSKVAILTGEQSPLVPPEWERLRLKVWYLIAEQGGIVDTEQLHQIADRIGMDRRGLGGFFAGDNASLAKIAGEKIALKEWAAIEVERYREWVRRALA
jgi:hypothetical protein